MIGWLDWQTLEDHVVCNIPDESTATVWLNPIGTLLRRMGLEPGSATEDRWRQRMQRSRRRNRISLNDAEDLCHLVGWHPTGIWGHGYYAAMPEPEWEPQDQFCGREEQWQAIGHTRHYGLYQETRR